MEDDHFNFLLTEPLRTMICDAENTFDWSRMSEYPGLLEIYNLLSQLGLQQAGVESVDLSGVQGYTLHPIPSGCETCADSHSWAEELGRLYVVHEACNEPRRRPFIGVGCTSAFSGAALGSYLNPEGRAAFPLVGPQSLSDLDDEEIWDVPSEWSGRSVSFRDAKSHLYLLGGDVVRPSGSSHYQVRFKGGRTWPLDSNYRDVPEPHLRELPAIVKQDLIVIKYVLSLGRWPRKIRRLDRYRNKTG